MIINAQDINIQDTLYFVRLIKLMAIYAATICPIKEKTKKNIIEPHKTDFRK